MVVIQRFGRQATEAHEFPAECSLLVEQAPVFPDDRLLRGDIDASLVAVNDEIAAFQLGHGQVCDAHDGRNTKCTRKDRHM